VKRPKFETTVFDAAISASRAQGSAELVSAVDAAFTWLGFEYFAVYEAKADGERVGLHPLVGKAHAAWQAHYRASDLVKADLRLRRGRMSARDFFCSEILQKDVGVSGQERAFFDAAALFGLNDSYVLPYRTAGGRVFAAVLIGSGAPVTPHLRVGLRTIAHEFIFAALRLRIGPPAQRAGEARSALTPRQRECLAWSLDGKSSADMAVMLGISARTVDGHIADACRALGVRTRIQAATLAQSEGLLI
jgi:LuxR family quorum-sensing system transcriptional regulator CciR